MKTIVLNNIKIVDTDIKKSLLMIDKQINNKIKSYICFCEGNILSKTVSCKKLVDVLNKAGMVFPDGIIMKLIAKAKGYKTLHRISGPTFMLKAFEYGQKQNWRHFLYGSTDEVLKKLEKKFTEQYPNIQIVGKFSPPFRDLTYEEELEVKNMIESCNPDLLWVGLGGPKQEYWMNDHLNKIDVPIMLGVGAAFDFHSGNKLWAPKFIRKIGMEWLFRMLTGGRNTFSRNIKCVSVVSLILITTALSNFVLFS